MVWWMRVRPHHEGDLSKGLTSTCSGKAGGACQALACWILREKAALAQNSGLPVWHAVIHAVCRFANGWAGCSNWAGAGVGYVFALGSWAAKCRIGQTALPEVMLLPLARLLTSGIEKLQMMGWLPALQDAPGDALCQSLNTMSRAGGAVFALTATVRNPA